MKNQEKFGKFLVLIAIQEESTIVEEDSIDDDSIVEDNPTKEVSLEIFPMLLARVIYRCETGYSDVLLADVMCCR